MKTVRVLLAGIFLVAGLVSYAPKAAAQQVDVSLSVFHNNLSIYGRWVTTPRYGEVWVYDEPGFRPYYTKGRWQYTDYGWAWQSDYDWGWAPFHYGRWELDPYYGWIWIPGYEWAPAWVSWSEAEGYYGWAPLGFGLSINVSFGAIPQDRWMYVPRRDICNYNIRNYCVPYSHNRAFTRSVVINNIYINNHNNSRYVAGPQRREVERYTNRQIVSRPIVQRPQRLAMNDNNNRQPVRVQEQRENFPRATPQRNFPQRDVQRSNENVSRADRNLPQRQDNIRRNNFPQRDNSKRIERPRNIPNNNDVRSSHNDNNRAVRGHGNRSPKRN